MITCTVELYGLSAEQAGRTEIILELPGENPGIPELIAALKKEAPELIGTVLEKKEDLLMEGQSLNIAGRFFNNHDSVSLNDGERVRLLTAAIGG